MIVHHKTLSIQKASATVIAPLCASRKNRDPILVCVAWLPTFVLSININHLALVFINQLTIIDHRDMLQQLAVKFLTRKCLNASREMPKFQTRPYIWLPSFLVLT